MNEAQHIIPRLKRLEHLEETLSVLVKNGAESTPISAEITLIRSLLPTAILRHRDLRKQRGKKSLAAVVRGVCGACHLAIPSGRLADLRKIHDDLNVCDNCGCFIYLPEESEAVQVNQVKRLNKSARESGNQLKRKPVATAN